MLSSIITSALLLSGAAIAVPAAKVDYNKVDYPKGTGENLHYYPPPPGGWEKVDYPDDAGANLAYYPPPRGGRGKNDDKGKPGVWKHSVFTFTSTYHVVAVGANVRNSTAPFPLVPGPKDAVGYFNYGINSKENTICYNITLLNVVGDYQSPAKTATHIHQAAKDAAGPPRIAFPNPVGDDKRRVSVGCLVGPFTTGLKSPTGEDTGTGFTVAEIEKNPAGFFTDSHTKLFPVGVVRGQLG